MSKWYVRDTGKEHGPISLEELRKHFQSGRLNRDTPIRLASEMEWKLAAEFPILFAVPDLVPRPEPIVPDFQEIVPQEPACEPDEESWRAAKTAQHRSGVRKGAGALNALAVLCLVIGACCVVGGVAQKSPVPASIGLGAVTNGFTLFVLASVLHLVADHSEGQGRQIELLSQIVDSMKSAR